MFSLKPVFTVDQLKRLANIFDNAGQVLFAGAVLGPIVDGSVNLVFTLFGILSVLVCWLLAVALEKRGNL